MKRLSQIQVALKAPKDNKADKFKFRSAEDILENVKPLLKDTETALVLQDELTNIGERVFLKATASLYGNDGHGGLIAQATAFAELDEHTILDKYTKELKKSMSNEQATGCASSYARKYALCGLFAIDNSEQDPDNDEIGHAEQPKSAQQVNHSQQAQSAPKTQGNAQGTLFPKLTPREQEEYDQACADCDAAETREQLQMTWERYKATAFNGQLAEKVLNIRKQKGW